MARLSDLQRATLAELNKAYGSVVTRGQVMDHYKKGNFPRWLLTSPEFRLGRGTYSTVEGGEKIVLDPAKPFPKFRSPKATKINAALQAAAANVAAQAAEMTPDFDSAGAADQSHTIATRPTITIGVSEDSSLIPQKNPAFVPFGNYADVHRIIKTRIFYPIFLTGLSGGGKTMLVQQACANLKRELVRVQVTPETDEDDLIGGFRLINGETVWFDGPVTVAAQRGAICLVDEIDYGTGKISCLQGILEGNGIFLKKVNRFVPLTPGFNIIATGNTKGRGSEERGGRYINTQIMNEAFLERFGVTLEQDFPNAKIELQILENELVLLGKNTVPNTKFAANLVTWAEAIRRTFEVGGVEDVISTRRLVHIIRAQAVFDDPKKAIEKCVTRFDRETQDGFIDLFDKICVPEVPGMNQPLSAFDPNDPNAPVQTATVGVPTV